MPANRPLDVGLADHVPLVAAEKARGVRVCAHPASRLRPPPARTGQHQPGARMLGLRKCLLSLALSLSFLSLSLFSLSLSLSCFRVRALDLSLPRSLPRSLLVCVCVCVSVHVYFSVLARVHMDAFRQACVCVCIVCV